MLKCPSKDADLDRAASKKQRVHREKRSWVERPSSFFIGKPIITEKILIELKLKIANFARMKFCKNWGALCCKILNEGASAI